MAQPDVSGSTTSHETPGAQANERLDQAARAFTDKVSTEVSELGTGTRQLAQDFAGEAREKAQTKLSGGKEHAALGLGTLAEALRNSGEQLRSDEQETLPRYLDGAAEKLERASEYLRYTDLSDVVHDVESFARREPALFVGGAFALGLIGGRFLKSSRKRANPGVRDGRSTNRVSRASGQRPNSDELQGLKGAQRGARKSAQGADQRAIGSIATSEERPAQGGKAQENGNPTRPRDTRAGDVG